MATKFKGIYKGFKYITQIFVVKEREMEIGYPTDVKHVAHIGWDGASGNAPSWMNEFKSPPDFSTSTIGNPRDAASSLSFSPWSSQDYDHQSIGSHSVSNGFKDTAPITDRPNIPKKQKRKKKTSSTSLPKSSAGRSRTSRAAKSKPALHDLDSPVFQV